MDPITTDQSGEINLMYANVGNDVSEDIAFCNSSGYDVLSTTDITYIQIARCLNILLLNPHINLFVFAEFCAPKVTSLLALLNLISTEDRPFGIYLHAQNRDTSVYDYESNVSGFHPKITDLKVDSYYKYFGIIYNRKVLTLDVDATSRVMSLKCFGELILRKGGKQKYAVNPIIDIKSGIHKDSTYFSKGTYEHGVEISKTYEFNNLLIHMVERTDYNVHDSISKKVMSDCLGQYCQLGIFTHRITQFPLIIANPHLMGTIRSRDWGSQMANIYTAIRALGGQYLIAGDFNISGTDPRTQPPGISFPTPTINDYYNNIILFSGAERVTEYLSYVQSNKISMPEWEFRSSTSRSSLPVIIPFSNHPIVCAKYIMKGKTASRIIDPVTYPHFNYETSAFNECSNVFRSLAKINKSSSTFQTEIDKAVQLVPKIHIQEHLMMKLDLSLSVPIKPPQPLQPPQPVPMLPPPPVAVAKSQSLFGNQSQPQLDTYEALHADYNSGKPKNVMIYYRKILMRLSDIGPNRHLEDVRKEIDKLVDFYAEIANKEEKQEYQLRAFKDLNDKLKLLDLPERPPEQRAK